LRRQRHTFLRGVEARSRARPRSSRALRTRLGSTSTVKTNVHLGCYLLYIELKMD
jgi:hypothetical protein